MRRGQHTFRLNSKEDRHTCLHVLCDCSMELITSVKQKGNEIVLVCLSFSR